MTRKSPQTRTLRKQTFVYNVIVSETDRHFSEHNWNLVESLTLCTKYKLFVPKKTKPRTYFCDERPSKYSLKQFAREEVLSRIGHNIAFDYFQRLESGKPKPNIKIISKPEEKQLEARVEVKEVDLLLLTTEASLDPSDNERKLTLYELSKITRESERKIRGSK